MVHYWLLTAESGLPMTYLIDGHNLIAQFPGMSLDDPNDEAMLVQKLSGFVARSKRRCVVVFDYGLPGGKSRMSCSASSMRRSISRIEVMYSSSFRRSDGPRSGTSPRVRSMTASRMLRR